MDNRGVPFSVGAATDKGEQNLVELMSKGRIEQMLQKTFVLSRDKFVLQLSYKSEEMADIKEEMKMLDSDEEDATKILKQRWNDLKD